MNQVGMFTPPPYPPPPVDPQKKIISTTGCHHNYLYDLIRFDFLSKTLPVVLISHNIKQICHDGASLLAPNIPSDIRIPK